MNAECIAVMRALEEGAVTAEVASHVAACPACQKHHLLLDVLADLPPGEADEEAVAALVQSLPHARWQLRRISTWAPTALGLGLMAGGLALLGGVPASGALPSAGGVVGAATAWATAWMADVATVLRGSASAISTLVAVGSVWLLAWLAATGIGGGWLVYALVRRHPGERE